MIEQIFNYFSFEMIYLWINIGVLPFWSILLFFPQSNLCKIFVASVFPLVLFSITFTYAAYLVYLDAYDFLLNFKLYLGLEYLLELFSNKNFLILFWVHFLSINLFCGCWIVKDSQKYNVSKALLFLPLITTYFIGPIGLTIYWILKIFYAKKINLFD